MKSLRILLLSVCTAAMAAGAAIPYDRLQQRADRFFDQNEWAQASATYYQMIEQRPAVAASYGRAIVANAMRADTLAQMQLMGKAIDNKIAFDSVLSQVKSTSFAVGSSSLYGNFLLLVKEHYPWMRRPVDNYLLRYYSYRRDGAKMMEYARTMLQGDSSNVGFLTTLADGAMLCGRFDEATATYRRVLSIAPDNINALLQLGCYYYAIGDYAQAIPCLTRAERLHTTPHIRQMLSSIDPAFAGRRHRRR